MHDKPSTPLPWELDEEFQVFGSNYKLVAWTAVERQDAEYIVRACNAYPELIESVRALRAELQRARSIIKKLGDSNENRLG
jgi:hypothetical protein